VFRVDNLHLHKLNFSEALELLSVEGVEIFKPFFTQIGLWVVALVISISDCQKNGKKREGGGDYLLTVSLVFSGLVLLLSS
jgi:hypothetical protein